MASNRWIFAVFFLAAGAQFLPAAARAGHSELGELEAAAAQLYVWGFPLVEAAKIRLRVTRPEYTGGKNRMVAPLNQFSHKRRLAGPCRRVAQQRAQDYR